MVLIKSMFLYTVKTLEVFVFCYAGEFLSSKVSKEMFLTSKICDYTFFLICSKTVNNNKLIKLKK